MITEKKLQSIYITEVTKQDILSGLDKGAKKYEKVYCVIYDGGSVRPIIGSLSEVISRLEGLIDFNEEGNKEDLTDNILKGDTWTWQGYDDPNSVEVKVSSNKNDILEDINWRLDALRAAQTKIAHG